MEVDVYLIICVTTHAILSNVQFHGLGLQLICCL